MKYNAKIVVAYFKESGLPEPQLEFKFHPERKWRFDFAWLQEGLDGVARVALEVEGGIWTGGAHGRGSGIARDIEKYNAAAVCGWRVLRCQPKDLCTQATVNMIKSCLHL